MPFCRRRDDTVARVAGPVQDAQLHVIEVEHKEKLSEAAHPAPAWHFNSTVWAPPDLQSHLTGAAGFCAQHKYLFMQCTASYRPRGVTSLRIADAPICAHEIPSLLPRQASSA